MSRWRDDLKALTQVGDRRAVAVADSLVEHQCTWRRVIKARNGC
jgi:hypothetical protein